MGDPAVFVAVLALLVSALALVLVEVREHGRMRREEESGRREEARFRREELEANTSQMGRPTTDLLGIESGPPRTYRFRVTNIGRASMTDLKPFLVDESGVVASEPLLNEFLNALQPQERTDFLLTVAEPFNQNPLFLRYVWLDDYGRREHLSSVAVPEG